jgi:uncharacterized phage protein (predicted DNA packaging)
MIIDLATIKRHLNLDADYTEDDTYLEFLEGVAEEVVQKHIDKSFEDFIEEVGEIPQPLLHSILLIIGNLYDNRESVAYTNAVEIPNSLSYILSMYRDYTDGNI